MILAAVIPALLLALVAPVQAPRVALGSVAPDFSGSDDRGRTIRLADYRGKYLVLEWHEKGCPYVTKHYRSGHMQALQREWMSRGVQWLMITSSTEGSHSYLTAAESQSYLADLKAAPTAHILDLDGTIGRSYGTTTALHMVIVAPDGKVIYNGAIDDKPTTAAADLATAHNYVTAALTAALAGQPIANATNTPYGCSIHYGR